MIVGNRPADRGRRSCIAWRPRRPPTRALNIAEEGPSRRRVRRRHGSLPDQLSVRLVGDQGDSPERSSSRWATRRSRGRAGQPAEGLDRRLQPRRLGVLAARRSSPSRRPVPDPAQESDPRRDQGRAGAGAGAASTTSPRSRRPYPFHALIKEQLSHYGIRPQTPGLRGRDAGDPGRALPDLETSTRTAS